VWVPHPGLAELSKGKEGEILAGRGEGGEVDVHQLGEVGDGWGEQLVTLENFPYEKYGIITERDG
jgi:pseudouridine-5'-monophosphatase